MRTAASFLLLFALCVTASAQPAIRLGFTVMDLGPIYHGEVRNVPLIVRNTGTQVLTISGVETSCGCTTAKRNVDAIPPGGADTIRLSFNSLGFHGPITKVVTVRSNDPAHPYAEARLTGTVTSLLEAVPNEPVADLGVSNVNETKLTVLRFRNTTDRLIIIPKLSCADPAIRPLFTGGSVAPGDTIAFSITFAPQARQYYENFLYVETADARQPRIPFRIMYVGR